jgi:hypothetical protein
LYWRNAQALLHKKVNDFKGLGGRTKLIWVVAQVGKAE